MLNIVAPVFQPETEMWLLSVSILLEVEIIGKYIIVLFLMPL